MATIKTVDAEIVVDRASKFYEPGEKVTGHINFKDFKMADLDNFTFKAECFMDTVSQIRGAMGRPPLEEKDKIYMMKKTVDHFDNPTSMGKSRLFEFVLEPTEKDERLIDVYIGVDFSIVVSNID